jgi:hypothetical protein
MHRIINHLSYRPLLCMRIMPCITQQNWCTHLDQCHVTLYLKFTIHIEDWDRNVWWNTLIHISDLTIKGNKVFVIVAYLPILGMNINVCCISKQASVLLIPTDVRSCMCLSQDMNLLGVKSILIIWMGLLVYYIWLYVILRRYIVAIMLWCVEWN